MTTPIRHWQAWLWPDARPLELQLLEAVCAAARALDPQAPELQLWPLASGGLPPGASDQRLWLLTGDNPPPLTALQRDSLAQRLASGQPLVVQHHGLLLLASAGLLRPQQEPLAVERSLADSLARLCPQLALSRQLFTLHKGLSSGCGGLATLDLALALLARDRSDSLADQVAALLHAPLPRPTTSLQRPLLKVQSAGARTVQEAVQLMRANVEEPLSSDELAGHVGVSRRQLERLFKQHLQQVPGQYYLELRLKRAQEMLLASGTSIIQIGLSCGFSSASHFSSAYRGFFGITPREERAKRFGAAGGSGGERG